MAAGASIGGCLGLIVGAFAVVPGLWVVYCLLALSIDLMGRERK